jgi:Na+/melibiose symporter-like transporter
LLCAGILFAVLYPLNRAEFARIVAELEQRRRQKTPEKPPEST